MWSQCLPYQGELDGGFIADGRFVVARRDAPGLLQQADPVLDLVSGLVFLAVEDGRTASGRTPAEAVSHLVPLLRDGVRDVPPSQVFADLAGGVGPVSEHVNGPGPRTAAAGAGNADAVRELGEQRGVAPLAGGDGGGQDLEGGIDGEVDLCGQAAARAADRVVVRLGRQTGRTRPARIMVPLFRAPAACWWTRQIVESTETSHSMCPAASALTCSFSRTRAQAPSICQRRKT